MSDSIKHFDPSAGIIIVTATISARVQTSARLVFDTGATYCMLPWHLINQLGIDIDQAQTIKTTTASTIETSPIVTLPAMEVLKNRVENVGCLVRDLPPDSGVDGLLGLSFLKYFRVKMDFGKGILELDRLKPRK
jgi:predicted aspartyl protease